MQRKKGSKRIEMIIKMVNEFKLTVFHLRAQTRCNSEHACGFTVRQQNCVGLRATGPPGRWAVGRGPLGRGSAFSKTQVKSCTQPSQQLLTRIVAFTNVLSISPTYRYTLRISLSSQTF